MSTTPASVADEKHAPSRPLMIILTLQDAAIVELTARVIVNVFPAAGNGVLCTISDLEKTTSTTVTGQSVWSADRSIVMLFMPTPAISAVGGLSGDVGSLGFWIKIVKERTVFAATSGEVIAICRELASPPKTLWFFQIAMAARFDALPCWMASCCVTTVRDVLHSMQEVTLTSPALPVAILIPEKSILGPGGCSKITSTTPSAAITNPASVSVICQSTGIGPL
mmetsp:Transcript_57861/g.84825  ORF Transcript_57861/g.84825 Transcript_57861/m.84825 type:complete len:224 (-) Transcript_57861:1404-2075(-)